MTVYIVKIGKFAKIGFTTNLDGRLASFRTTVVDPEVLLTLDGDRTLERRLHELLADDRVARELFHFARVGHFIDIVKYAGLERGLEYLSATTRAGMERARRESREDRVRVARLTKEQENAELRALVSDRKRRLGW